MSTKAFLLLCLTRPAGPVEQFKRNAPSSSARRMRLAIRLGVTGEPSASNTCSSSSSSKLPSPLESISSNLARSTASSYELQSSTAVIDAWSSESTSCHWMPNSSFSLPLSAASLKSSWKVTAVKSVEMTSKIVVSLSTRSMP